MESHGLGAESGPGTPPPDPAALIPAIGGRSEEAQPAVKEIAARNASTVVDVGDRHRAHAAAAWAREAASDRWKSKVRLQDRGPACSVDSGQDGDGVIGQPTPGRCETYTPTIRLNHPLASHFGQRCDLLRHSRRRKPKSVRDFPHLAQPRQRHARRGVSTRSLASALSHQLGEFATVRHFA